VNTRRETNAVPDSGQFRRPREIVCDDSDHDNGSNDVKGRSGTRWQEITMELRPRSDRLPSTWCC
jgi:hypothetical protein